MEYLDYQEWADVYKKLIAWDIEFSTSQDQSMAEVLETQKLTYELCNDRIDLIR